MLSTFAYTLKVEKGRLNVERVVQIQEDGMPGAVP
jgi:hypothetical protein